MKNIFQGKGCQRVHVCTYETNFIQLVQLAIRKVSKVDEFMRAQNLHGFLRSLATNTYNVSSSRFP